MIFDYFIHDTKDGMSTFKCGTRYDWYVIKKTPSVANTIVKDEQGVTTLIDMKEWSWLPNSNFDLIRSILAERGEPKCNVIQSMSSYEPRKSWMSNEFDDEFMYPVIHSTTKKEVRYKFSNRNDNGHFGVSKVIFGDSGINEPINDVDGDYGMTQHAIGIEVRDTEEADNVITALKSNVFAEVIKSCSWSTFAIEWNMFSDFKRDFYTVINNNK